jgi:uncharacterized damage-inducible protein DinB
MSIELPQSTQPIADRRDVFLGYLDYSRDRIITKVESLPEADLRSSRLASGWTPIEMLKHLTYVERRWIEWGMQGLDIGEPWGDARDDRWYVAADESLRDVVAALRAQGVRTSDFVRATDLEAAGQPSGRWNGDDPASLERVLFHLMQEYACHLGHVEIVVEIASAP